MYLGTLSLLIWGSGAPCVWHLPKSWPAGPCLNVFCSLQQHLLDRIVNCALNFVFEVFVCWCDTRPWLLEGIVLFCSSDWAFLAAGAQVRAFSFVHPQSPLWLCRLGKGTLVHVFEYMVCNVCMYLKTPVCATSKYPCCNWAWGPGSKHGQQSEIRLSPAEPNPRRELLSPAKALSSETRHRESRRKLGRTALRKLLLAEGWNWMEILSSQSIMGLG